MRDARLIAQNIARRPLIAVPAQNRKQALMVKLLLIVIHALFQIQLERLLLRLRQIPVRRSELVPVLDL